MGGPRVVPGWLMAAALLPASARAQPAAPSPAPDSGQSPSAEPAPVMPAPGPAPLPATRPPLELRVDTAEKDDEREDAPTRVKLPWRESLLRWDQSASGTTVGVGQDYQSRNPSYEMTLVLAPRYYLYEDERQTLGLRAELGLFREFTNSDRTTRRGEWSFLDTALLAAYSRELYGRDEVRTKLLVRAPVLMLPTSRASGAGGSARSGTFFGLGAAAGLAQTLPLLGTDASTLRTVTFIGTVGYDHNFTRATEAVAPDLQRVRMTPEGRTTPGDQLNGAALAQHQLTLGLLVDTALSERVGFTSALLWRPVWKYGFEDSECIRIQNDCVTPDRVDEPTRYGVVTLFSAEVSVRPFPELTVAFGYVNATLQLGPSGERRNLFYSPDARFYVSAITYLDELYLTVSGQREETTGPSGSPGNRSWDR